MFSFFRRNKSRPQESDNQNINNNNNATNNTVPRVSVNMQLAIERQQASLAALLDQKKKNDVNDREQKEPHSGNPSQVANNRFATLPAVVSECNALPNLSARARQNYDQHRDSKRATYSTYDHFVGSRHSSNAPSHNPADHLLLPTTIVASQSSSSPPINEKQQQQNFTIAGTSSTSYSNPFDEVMGRGRKNNRNNRGSNFNKRYQQNGNQNRNQVNESVTVPATVQFACNANEEKIISNENVSHATTSSSSAHDENSCSINSMTDNTDDNITAVASDVNEKTVEIPPSDNNIVSAAASYEERQQVKRVTFAPSPPTATRSRIASIESLSDDSDGDGEEEETTISEDIFYEANASEVKILSTVTSHSRIDEGESTKKATPGLTTSDSLEQANKSDNNSDVVCAKIILSVNENESNEKVDDGNAFNNGITSGTSSDCNGISNEDVNDERETSPPKTIKPSYKLVGDEPIALPDILDSALPDILLEQNSHMVDADVANIVSHASSYGQQHGVSMSTNQVEIVDQMQLKVNELCMKIDELEHELNIKAGTVDRLQSELECANKEGETVRQRLRYQNEQLERVKEKSDLEKHDDSKKYASLEKQYKDSVGKLQKMQNLASNLNVQLAQASVDIEKLRQERDELLDKLTVHEKLLREILETAMEEREQSAAKWKAEFEHLRNVNCAREESLMEDCEWKVRQMMKQCKEKLEKVEKEKLTLKDQAQIDRQTIRSQRDEIKNLKATEREANQLRGLSNEQKESITTMTKRIEELKMELENVKKKLQAEIDSCQQIKRDCAYQLSERERWALNRIEIARGEVAIEWENRLLEEMTRLKMELEQVHIDDRNAALNELKAEHLLENQTLATKFKQREETLNEEIASLKTQLEAKQTELRGLEAKADLQLMEHRTYIERQERLHQKEIDKLQLQFDTQQRLHSDLIDDIKEEHKREKEQIKASFYRSLEQIKEEFANEITLTTETMQAKHKKEMEEQWKQLVQEKESALQAAENRLRIKLEDADNKLSSVMTRHQRQLNDLRDNFEIERTRIETRDVQNSQEIDTLRRKCICLTKLFEEMRVRYERREPRVEDIARINELKSVVDSQEKDICQLTEQLRDLQLQMQSHQNQLNQQQNSNQSNGGGGKKNKGRNNSNNKNNNNRSNNNVRHQTQQQNATESNATTHDDEISEEIQQQTPKMPKQQRIRPPPLIKTVIYEEENENELYEEQLREEREREAMAAAVDNDFTVEHVPESPDAMSTNKRILEEISEALIVQDHEILNQPVIPSPTPDHKNQEIAIEVISTIEPSNIQVIPFVENGLDLELD